MTRDGASATEGRRLRVGVLGNSYWAWWCHGSVLEADPEVDLVGYWGRSPERTLEATRQTGGRAFAHLDDLLDEVDAVSIALPPDVQAEVAVRAARAGKHLLLDKPLALNLADADAVVDEVLVAGVRTLSFMTLLFQPDTVDWLTKIRLLADSEGPWDALTISMAGSIDEPGSPYAASAWRHEHGGLWDWGPHALSLVNHIQAPVSRVSATRGVRDTVTVVLEHADGACSILTLTVKAPPLAQHSTATLWGPGGRHHIDLPRENLREAYARAQTQFRDCIQSRTEHLLNAQYGRDVVAILDAARRNLDRPIESRADVPLGRVDASGPGNEGGSP